MGVPLFKQKYEINGRAAGLFRRSGSFLTATGACGGPVEPAKWHSIFERHPTSALRLLSPSPYLMGTFKRRASRTWIVWTIGIFGGLMALVLLVSWVVPRIFKKQLDTSLRTSVREASNGLYSLDYGVLSLNMLLGNAELTDVVIKADSAAYARLHAQQKAPDQVIDLRTEQLRLEGVFLTKLLLLKALSMDRVLVQNPQVIVTIKKQEYNRTKKAKPPYEVIRKVLRSVEIDKISFTNVDFRYINNDKRPSRQNHLQELYLDVSDFLLNEETAADTSRILFARQLELRMKGLVLDPGNALYTFQLEELSLSSEDSTLRVKNVHFRPRYSKEQFGKAAGISVDRYDFRFEKIRAVGVDLSRLLTGQQFVARSLYVEKGLMDVFRDRRYPDPKESKMGRYPHQLLRQADLTVRIDTVRIKGTQVLYGEQSQKTGLRGTVRFNGTQGTITNLTNDTATIGRNPYCRMRVSASFMGQSTLQAYFNFNLAAANGAFSCGGSLRDFPMPRVNPVTEALAKASVESGTLKRMDFAIRATDHQAQITTHLLYDDLKVQVLKQDRTTGELEERSFLSNLLNGMVIKDSNPPEGRPARVGEATVQRQPSDSFFNLIWQSILASIKGVVTGTAEPDEKPDQEEPVEKKKKGFLRKLFSK
jgi:hypothetical protein